MDVSCPICEATVFDGILRFPRVPIFHIIPPGQSPTDDDFGALDIVRCKACGHLFNRGYSPETGSRIHSGGLLSNEPVSVSMSQGLERVADWIGDPSYADLRVLEVGAGSGHMARIMARKASEVLVFEPALGLREEALPESNVTLLNLAFDPCLLSKPVDMVVCRQVLEHLADPLVLLCQMREALSHDGKLYLEVPRAEFIEEQTALFEFHYAHVQYYHEQNLLALAKKAGFKAERLWHLKDGHDVGVLFSADEPALENLSAAANQEQVDFGLRLASCRDESLDLLGQQEGDLVFYGATSQGSAFLTAMGNDREFASVLDDNFNYSGCVVYSSQQSVPICSPTSVSLEGVSTVFITAYSHEKNMLMKLRSLGFSGRVVGANPKFAYLN